MKNLIEEIIKNKLDIEQHNDLFACAWNSGIDKCCSIIENYNIITAPKSIKLSEIVSKLNSCDKRNKFKKIIKTYETTVVENTEFKKEYFYIKNNKIFDLSDYMGRDEYKWLYTLWIADTIIEDDMVGDE